MAEGERLALTQRERDRLTELHAVLRKQIRIGEAAGRLHLSSRQVKRLLRRIRRKGDRGVIHGLRGRPSNRRFAPGIRERALKLLRRAVYRDFGPTLAAEHLARRHIRVSRETLRKWMSGEGLWRPRRQRIEAVHTWRERRAAFGELVLMDTSDHDWLEGRGPELDLVAMIDDATSRLWGRFVDHNSTDENLRTLRGWLERYGRPLALYTDKHSIFVTPRKPEEVERWGEPPPTDFGAALAELGIEWIAAHSPQAKGRVERLFETLQDRLLKELRVAGVDSLQAANRFLDEYFLAWWESRFVQAPRNPHDAHRPLLDLQLDSVLCRRDERVVTGDYTISLGRRRWAIARSRILPGLRKARVIVETRLDGSIWLRFRKHRLPLKPVPAAPPVSPSGLRPPGPTGERCTKWNSRSRPAPDHPWRKFPATGSFLPCGEGDISTLR